MKKMIILIGVIVILIGGLITWQSIKSKNSVLAPAKTSSQQVVPVKNNPISNTSEQPGLVIKASAEDNTDPQTKQAIGDRLQITLQNTSAQPMTNIEVFYSMKDKKTGQVESYYQKLSGLILTPHESRTVAFDNEKGAGHYPENKYSLYRSSQNEVDFTIEVSTPGFKPVTSTTLKSAGTGETGG